MSAELLPLGVDELGQPDIAAALLALNNAHAAELSWLEPARLHHLVQQSFMARHVGAADGLMIALDQDAEYDSPNFKWFRARFPRFVYVDRVVVAPVARGRGIARRCYGALFEAALRHGHTLVGCEVNAVPPNPRSSAFHAALGFDVIGSAVLDGSGKTVRYMARRLEPPSER